MKNILFYFFLFPAIAEPVQIFNNSDTQHLLQVIPAGVHHGYKYGEAAEELQVCTVEVDVAPGIYAISIKLAKTSEQHSLIFFTEKFGGTSVERDYRNDLSWTVVTERPVLNKREFDTSLIFQKGETYGSKTNFLVYSVGHFAKDFKCNIVLPTP